MIITIDGPAGSGKSTVARALARRLGFRFLDTGAMYRAVALAAVREGVDFDQPDQLATLVETINLEVREDRVLLNGEDVTEVIRTSEVTAATRHAADNRAVRERLVRLQREAAAGGNIVTEGRDQGSVVFPNAPCKFFLTATAEERARRRLADLRAQGESPTLDAVLRAQQRRDREDQHRPVGPMVRAADAIEVHTDAVGLEEVVDRLEAMVRKSL